MIKCAALSTKLSFCDTKADQNFHCFFLALFKKLSRVAEYICFIAHLLNALRYTLKLYLSFKLCQEHCNGSCKAITLIISNCVFSKRCQLSKADLDFNLNVRQDCWWIAVIKTPTFAVSGEFVDEVNWIRRPGGSVRHWRMETSSACHIPLSMATMLQYGAESQTYHCLL